MKQDTDSLQLAAALAAAAGLTEPVSLQPLTGGKNNRVFLVNLADGQKSVLKLYHHDPRDPRDRLRAEWSFIDYVWARGVRNVPRPLAHDPQRHAGLYGFVPGRWLAPGEINAAVVSKASDFVIAINGAPRETDLLAPGSEACFSLGDHLQTVERRVARLNHLDESAPFVIEAADLVEKRLRPVWEKIRASIVGAAPRAGVGLNTPVTALCVSPSDFGYHNALVSDDGSASFIDFEYAGRDDPAKLVCDFFSQPEVPVSLDHFDAFVTAIAQPLMLSAGDLWRCRALLPAYRLKWVCIILNEFLPVGASRRAFADDGDRKARAARQIERASRHLDLVPQ